MANADKYWVGSGANAHDYSNANNWAATLNGAGGDGAPEADDRVWIFNLANPITAGLAQGGVDLQSFFCSIAPGGSLDGLVIAVSNTTTIGGPQAAIVNYGQSPVRISAGTNGIDALTVRGGPQFEIEAGTIPALVAYQTLLKLNETVAWTNAYLLGANAHILGGGSAGTISQTHVYGPASVICEREAETVNLHGSAVWTQKGTGKVDVQLNVYPGAKYRHNSTGDVDNIVVYHNGTADAIGATAPFTVAASTLHAGGKLFEQSAVEVTYTAATSKIGFGLAT